MSDTRLFICGLGVDPREEVTLEALQVFDSSAAVFTDLADRATLAWLRGWCRRLVTGARPAAIVAAARADGPVALAVWGHPQFNSALALETERRARAAKLRFEVLGAISPIGSAFARSISFLGGDYGYQGIQSYDLETLLAEPGARTNRLPLVAYSAAGRPRAWERLKRALLADLPPELEVRLYPGGSGEERRGALKALRVPVGPAVLLVPPDPAFAPRGPARTPAGSGMRRGEPGHGPESRP